MLIKGSRTGGMQIRNNSKSGGCRRKVNRTPASTLIGAWKSLAYWLLKWIGTSSASGSGITCAIATFRGEKDQINYAA